MLVVVRPAGEAAAITTASPVPARPCVSKALVHEREHLVGVGRDLGGQGRHAPLKAERPAHLHGRDERVDRHLRPLGREQPSRPSRLRVARDRDDPQVVGGDRRGGVGDGGTLARPRARGRRRSVRLAAILDVRRDRGGGGAASNGNPPIAVSPESIMASAPSRTALATSVVSARVGRRARGSSTRASASRRSPVAPPHGPLRSRSFWMSGISSIGSSTPRSPRATITASVTRRGSSSMSLHGRPGLDLRHDRHGPLPHQGTELLDVVRGRGRTTARPGPPRASSARASPSRSRSVTAGKPQPLGGHVHALSGRGPCLPARTPSARPHRLDRRDRELDGPVREQDAVAQLQIIGEPRVRRGRPGRVARPRRDAAANRCPGASVQRIGLDRAEPDLRAGQVGQDAPARGRPPPRPRGRARPRARAPPASRGRSSAGRRWRPPVTSPRTSFGVFARGTERARRASSGCHGPSSLTAERTSAATPRATASPSPGRERLENVARTSPRPGAPRPRSSSRGARREHRTRHLGERERPGARDHAGPLVAAARRWPPSVPRRPRARARAAPPPPRGSRAS